MIGEILALKSGDTRQPSIRGEKTRYEQQVRGSGPRCAPYASAIFVSRRQIANTQTAMMVPSVARPPIVQPAA
jgi:hypothetical protein